MHNSKILKACLIIIGIIFISFALLFFTKGSHSEKTLKVEVQQPNPTPETDFINKPQKSSETGPNYEVDPNAERFYKINVVQMFPPKDEGMNYPFVPGALVELFGLKTKTSDGKFISQPRIFFKGKGYTWENQSGEYVLELNKLNAKKLEYKLYQNKNFLVTVLPLTDRKIIPYVENVLYCEADSDCSVGAWYFCSSGSYNKYREMSVYGCESGDAAITAEDKKQCNLTIEHPVVKYGNPVCINHACTTDTRNIDCQAGAYSEGP